MTPQKLALRQLKANALRAGANGVLILRGIRSPELSFEAGNVPQLLQLDGQMLVVAIFPETDGEPDGIESGGGGIIFPG